MPICKKGRLRFLKSCIACAEKIQSDAKLCRHCGTLQDDDRFLPKDEKGTSDGLTTDGRQAEEGAVQPASTSKLIALSFLILAPSIALLALDPSLSDGGPAEAVGNFSASVAGWSVLSLVVLGGLWALPKLRSSTKALSVIRRLGYIFFLWAGIGVFLYGTTIVSIGASSPDRPQSTTQVSPPASTTDASAPTADRNNEQTLEACRTYQTWYNTRGDADGDQVGWLTDEQTKLVSLFRDVPNTRIRQAVNDHIAQIRVMKVVVSSNPSESVFELAASDLYATYVNVWELCNDEY